MMLRRRDRSVEPAPVVKPEAVQAILDKVAPIDPRGEKVKPQALIDNRFLEDMDRSGFFDQLWAKR